jgi:Tfp pilus assembly protein PilO
MNSADVIQWIAVMRRHPLSVFCACVCMVCALVSWYTYGNIKWLELEHRQINQDVDLAVSTMISGPSVRQELASTREVTRRIEDNLVVADNLAENLWYFYKIEQESKAHMIEMHPLSSASNDPKSLYRRIPFSIKVTGTYEQVGAFLYYTETGPRLSTITTLVLRRRDQGSSTILLDMTVELLGKK